jgi:iron complex outermembrane receptor protein
MSQEFQLFGDADRLEWQTGVMYFHEDGQVNGSNSLGWLYTGCDPLVYRATCGAPNIIPLTAMPTNFTRTNVATDSYGVYGQATWTPNILDDRLKLTLGLRYSNDEKDIERTLQSGAPVSGMKTTATSERVDPAVTVSYELFDSTSVYARYSTAYRGGGVSVRQIQTFTPYDPEEVESSELGIKSVFWDNRARVNAAAFYTEMDDMQTTVQQVCFRPGTTIPLCTASNTIFFNNPKTSRMSGFEMDASVIVVEGLTLSLAYSYLDASIPKVLDGTALRQPALSNSPRNSWAVNIDYDFEPFSFGQLSAHVDITDSDEYCFSVFSCEADAPMIAGDQEGVQGGNDNRLVNANLTLSDIPLSQFGTLKAALWGRNLTDGEYLNFGYTVPGGPATGNNSIGQYGEPRSWGVSLTYQY